MAKIIKRENYATFNANDGQRSARPEFIGSRCVANLSPKATTYYGHLSTQATIGSISPGTQASNPPTPDHAEEFLQWHNTKAYPKFQRPARLQHGHYCITPNQNH